MATNLAGRTAGVPSLLVQLLSRASARQSEHKSVAVAGTGMEQLGAWHSPLSSASLTQR